MPVRPCIVSFRDPLGFTHSVTVEAESLYEAAALALSAFRKAELMELDPGPATHISVAIQPPAVVHDLTVGKLRDWLTGGAKSPKEQVLKSRLNAILAAK